MELDSLLNVGRRTDVELVIFFALKYVNKIWHGILICRGGEIRTRDLVVPNDAR